ncbi:hypothetical protein DBR06_SOUSAS30310073, partial [Sousa chinensis]
GGDPGGGAQRLLPGLPLPVCSLASQGERREICVGALRVVVSRRAPFVPAVGPFSPHPPPRRWSALWKAQYQASLRMLRLGAPTSPFLAGVLIGCSDCSGCSGPESWLLPFESFIAPPFAPILHSLGNSGCPQEGISALPTPLLLPSAARGRPRSPVSLKCW